MAVGGLVLNVVLNLTLIPLYKAEGAAFATLVTQFTTAFVQVILVYKVFKLKINWKLTFQLFFLALLIFGFNLVVFVNVIDSSSNMLLLFLGSLCVATIIAFVLGVLPLKSALTILKEKS